MNRTLVVGVVTLIAVVAIGGGYLIYNPEGQKSFLGITDRPITITGGSVELEFNEKRRGRGNSDFVLIGERTYQTNGIKDEKGVINTEAEISEFKICKKKSCNDNEVCKLELPNPIFEIEIRYKNNDTGGENSVLLTQKEKEDCQISELNGKCVVLDYQTEFPEQEDTNRTRFKNDRKSIIGISVNERDETAQLTRCAEELERRLDKLSFQVKLAISNPPR